MKRGKREVIWWVYMISCRGGKIYTGTAIDPDARYEAHRAGKGAAGKHVLELRLAGYDGSVSLPGNVSLAGTRPFRYYSDCASAVVYEPFQPDGETCIQRSPAVRMATPAGGRAWIPSGTWSRRTPRMRTGVHPPHRRLLEIRPLFPTCLFVRFVTDELKTMQCTHGLPAYDREAIPRVMESGGKEGK